MRSNRPGNRDHETASTAVHKVSEKVGSGEGGKGAEGDDGGTPAGFVENPAKDHRAD